MNQGDSIAPNKIGKQDEGVRNGVIHSFGTRGRWLKPKGVACLFPDHREHGNKSCDVAVRNWQRSNKTRAIRHKRVLETTGLSPSTGTVCVQYTNCPRVLAEAHYRSLPPHSRCWPDFAFAVSRRLNAAVRNG